MKSKTKKPVVIRSVTVRSSIQLKSFQHLHIEASADVPDGEAPEYVVDKLKAFVAKELKVAKEGRVVPQPAVQGRFLDDLKNERTAELG
jgi:hypothetical protein